MVGFDGSRGARGARGSTGMMIHTRPCANWGGPFDEGMSPCSSKGLGCLAARLLGLVDPLEEEEIRRTTLRSNKQE